MVKESGECRAICAEVCWAVREGEMLMKRMAEVTTGFEERGDEEKVTL